ncbi:hypothetical protein A9Q87_04590 [Flavobacteriales bacterium 34_180_T64]|nr:hypothetical protein A9Q87_04590 [Flavobacteriales bacterium 34_180_T64]
MFEFPKISTYDPVTSSDGSLDPLGLYLIADRLATKLAPGIRQRMSHPRYLTAMALGAHICYPFYDTYASDGFSPAYQVFEWHIVEGFTSKYFKSDPDQIQGLPGIQKATDAFQDNLPLRASRYLKTPNVFGFHGVYRTLSTEIRVVSDDYNMLEVGDELLKALQEEKGLNGVYTGSGPWRDKVQRFRKGIQQSMEKGEVANGWYWKIHQEFASLLRPNQVGKKEAKVILRALRSETQPLRRQMIDFLLAENGQNAWKTIRSEKVFMAALKKQANGELQELINVIEYYERFARTFQDAFDACLFKMSKTGKATLDQLAMLPAVHNAMEEMPKVFSKIETGLVIYDLHHDFIRNYGSFEAKHTAKDWVMTMWEHHYKIQRSKGKIGKRNWFERTDDGTFRIYTSTTMQREPEMKDEFLHNYRAQPLWSFLVNLKLVEDGEE